MSAPHPYTAYDFTDEYSREEVVGAELVAETVVQPSPGAHIENFTDASQRRLLAAAIRHIATQRDLADLDRATCQHALELVAANRAHLAYYDGKSRRLWRETCPLREKSSAWSPLAGVPPASTNRLFGGSSFSDLEGVTGYAARNAITQVEEVAAVHARYRVMVDDPPGTGTERLIAQPIRDSIGEVQAVLVLVRNGNASPFSSREAHLLDGFSRQVGPLFESFCLERHPEHSGYRASPRALRGGEFLHPRTKPAELFRRARQAKEGRLYIGLAVALVISLALLVSLFG